jgi:hypothetical protein
LSIEAAMRHKGRDSADVGAISIHHVDLICAGAIRTEENLQIGYTLARQGLSQHRKSDDDRRYTSSNHDAHFNFSNIKLLFQHDYAHYPH